jgi:(2S)-methylsuccinyl-CoA dehydrogenase
VSPAFVASLPKLNTALAQIRNDLNAMAAALARACAANGTLDAAKLDQRQVPIYELAFASAELLAAETLLARASQMMQLDARLALVYGVETLSIVAERLRSMALEVDADLTALETLLASSEMRELRKRVLSGAALDQTGERLLASQDEIGGVALSEELEIVQREFRKFATERVTPIAARIHREDLTVPEALLQPLREMGVFGLSIPERFGGSAPNDRDDQLSMIVVTEALSEASLAAAGSLITRPEILARALLTGGTEQQKAHWLPRLAAGDPLCAIGITEPDYGSDVASLQLKATRVADGWVLNGAKTWCTFAGKAGVIMVVARTEADRSQGHRGLSLFLVEKPVYEGHEFLYQQPNGGQLSGRAIATIGYRGMHSFDLAFSDFHVGDANVIGETAGLGKGFYFTMAGMTGGRMQTAARACGVMRAALLAAIRYAGTRKVFGAPLADYALTRAKLARMAARFFACRELTYAVGRSLEADGDRVQASLVKLMACRSAEWLTREALQIHGGMGYAEESAVSRYFVDARVLSIFEGAEETLALKVIGRSVLEQALQA